jgi:pimeloyl-ACP methyl ester carboxylesterase
MTATLDRQVDWKNVPTRMITAGGVQFAYRELGTNNPGTPVVFLVHLAAVLDNWDPRVVEGFATSRRVITFDNRGVGASSGSPATSIEQMATDAITFIKAMVSNKSTSSILDGWDDRTGNRADGAATRSQDDHCWNGPAGGEGNSSVARVTYLDILRGFLTGQDAKQFLFFTRTSGGIRAGKEFLARLKERSQNRDKKASVAVLQAQLKALRLWGSKEPSDLSKIQQPVLVANGDSDRMVPTKNTHDLARRLPHSELIIYPDAGHGGVFQFHADFVPKALAFLAR